MQAQPTITGAGRRRSAVGRTFTGGQPSVDPRLGFGIFDLVSQRIFVDRAVIDPRAAARAAPAVEPHGRMLEPRLVVASGRSARLWAARLSVRLAAECIVTTAWAKRNWSSRPSAISSEPFGSDR